VASGSIRSIAGFPEAVASILTIVIFVISYWLESHNDLPDVLFHGTLLVGTLILCSIVVFGVLCRHFVPMISHLIVAGAIAIGLSQVVAFVESVPAFAHWPLVGREGQGYLVHFDDMLLYPGFVLMLCGFYLSIVHGTQMRHRLIVEAREKEEALEKSTQSAEHLARRVAFENLATTISTRFINVDQDEVDEEIQLSLQLVGEFMKVGRVHFVVSRLSLCSNNEHYEWCAEGVDSLLGEMRRISPAKFTWMVELLDSGTPVTVSNPSEMPPQAVIEREWMDRLRIQSFVRVPIISKARLRGYIGVESENGSIPWPDETVPLLRMIGEILLSAWDRRCVLQQRAMLEFQVQQAQKLESLGVMAGGIAHDFNNILTGIMGNAELAQLGAPEGGERHKYMEGIIQSSRRAAELCRQMLAYSGRGRFLTEKFSLNDLITEMTPLLRATVSRNAALDWDLASDLPEIEGDIAQFRQVLVNLVTNASEALEEGSGSVSIRTGSRHCSEEFLHAAHLAEPLPPGQYAFLEVRDTGCGMGREVSEKMFDPFFTTRFAGRGLGLPAVLGIVRGHRGAIELDTAPGQGTLIRLYFPALETASKNFLATGEVLGDWHGHGMVLLADDEEIVLSVGTMMLKHVGLDVITAPDGNTALERASQYSDKLQCIILDMSMPAMDGDATCARFKEQHPDVPIVIASGYMREELEGKFAKGRIAAFLSKPFELADIQSVMRGLLEPASR